MSLDRKSMMLRKGLLAGSTRSMQAEGRARTVTVTGKVVQEDPWPNRERLEVRREVDGGGKAYVREARVRERGPGLARTEWLVTGLTRTEGTGGQGGRGQGSGREPRRWNSSTAVHSRHHTVLEQSS